MVIIYLCYDRMHGSAPSRVAFGLEPRRLERGKRARWRAAGLDWTGPRASTTPPSCLVTTAIARSLRPCRTTRTVAARRAGRQRTQLRGPVRVQPLYPPGLLQSIPPTACQPQGPVCVRACRLGVAASADPVNGPPAAGSRLSLVSSRQRPASRRAPTESPAADPEHCFSWPRRRPASCRGARQRPGPPARVQPLPDSPSARGPQGHARDQASQLGPRQFVSSPQVLPADGTVRRVRVRRSIGSGHGAPRGGH